MTPERERFLRWAKIPVVDEVLEVLDAERIQASTYHKALTAIANIHPGAINAARRCQELAVDALWKEAE